MSLSSSEVFRFLYSEKGERERNPLFSSFHLFLLNEKAIKIQILNTGTM